ncbi:CaiB/BaiF CoA-transferase family protein [Agriterribacter sp.]|uniref:CaiB/BaiF CoA transferase family protein n=1 Tax=Agriterribacter sp. TaxID=2821509 RepID=UPI002CF06612|nr:CaiB/BaiF CoA-transferase family protein [Agriterribacter sp.]HRO45733.1 CaiB/BaiF CoA-transferase family protein [Agriterribacter sp.]HRQ15789.1 CaiB/BaiF CoA-transferase family protein [Agriterribacter sp.]
MSELLEDILVLDFSQFLSGPYASLRLSDMGARVIKIERPVIGDLCRTLYVSDVKIDGGESTIFHAINRNKESLAADIKKETELEKIKKLIRKADILIHNFRPGVMERIGLEYETVRQLNPAIIYAEISGYGEKGEWKSFPGQDLLLQSVSGITYLSGNQTDQPTPMGVAAADILAGTHLVQGILAAMFSRFDSGEGALVQVSMLESLIDFQFEVLTCFFNDGYALPDRSAVNNGHAYIAAPYGVYQTADGYIALAMGSIPLLGQLLQCDLLCSYDQPSEWFNKRDEIKLILKDHLLTKSTKEWLHVLEPADIWCSDVFDYNTLLKSEGYTVLDMEQQVFSGNKKIKTTRCPVRVDGKVLKSAKGAPALGEHTLAIEKEFEL